MQFGVAEWLRFFGEVDQSPTLPLEVESILDSPCPFWKNKRVRETHMIAFIPETLNNEKFHLNMLCEISQTPKQGKKISFKSYDKYVKHEHGNKSNLAHWILMTCDVLPDSRRLRFEKQKELLKSILTSNDIIYRLPTVLEAATCIIGAYLQTNMMLFSDDPWTYTRCLELVNQGQWPVSVGGFSNDGFYVHDCRFVPAHDYLGVAAVRQL